MSAIPATLAVFRSALLLGLALPAGAAGIAQDADAAAVAVERGVVYATHGGVELALDLCAPSAERGPGPYPALLFLHGGGWRGGDRATFGAMLQTAARAGFVAASASYRFTPAHRWPAQLDDVSAAVAWLRQNAGARRIDPQRIGVIGHSAGGHLALMLGAAAARPGGGVRAAVSLAGLSDLRAPGQWPSPARSVIEDLAGPEAPRAVYLAFSPIVQLRRGAAPVLSIHGEADRIVPLQQARVLHRELDRLGVPNRALEVAGAGHDLAREPGGALMTEALGFFDTYLRGSADPLLLVEDFDDGMSAWEGVGDPDAWRVEQQDGEQVLSLHRRGRYAPKVRSPYGIALLRDTAVADFVLDVRMRSTIADYGHRDLCVFFGWRDPTHFYYAHLGKAADDHANSIFLVDGRDRVTIARERTNGVGWDDGWHRVRVRRTVADGLIEVFFDDLERPVMSAVDTTFVRGRVGVGSFDDTGQFDVVRLRGRRGE